MDGLPQLPPVAWNTGTQDGTIQESSEYKGIGFRQGFDGSGAWHEVAASIRKFTDQKAIIDRVGRSRSTSTGRLRHFLYYAYVDVGSNSAEEELDEPTMQSIIDCAEEKDGIKLDTIPHNEYAGSRDWETEADLLAHYDFFGHGMVDGFDIDLVGISDDMVRPSDSDSSSQERGPRNEDSETPTQSRL